MTINLSDNTPRVVYSVAEGVTQTSFTVPFEFFESSDVSVYVDDTLQSEGSNYTVTGGDGSTGSITFSGGAVTGATGGSKVVLFRRVPLERTSDFNYGADINRGALNEQLDVLTAITADLKDASDRSLHVNDFEQGTNLELPTVAERKGKSLVFNATTGDPEAGPSIEDIETFSNALSLDQGVSTTDSPTFDGLLVDTTADNATLGLTSGSTIGTSRIHFGDPDNASAGQLRYEHANNAFEWYTGASEKMRLQGGNLGIGTSSPSEKLSVTGNISVTGTVDGRDVAADGARLDLAPITPQDYGAVGDGTTDDTTAMQAWVTELRTNGGYGYLPVGEYKVSTLYMHPEESYLIQGAGFDKSVIIVENTSRSGIGLKFTHTDGTTRNTGSWQLRDLRVESHANNKACLLEHLRASGPKLMNVKFIHYTGSTALRLTEVYNGEATNVPVWGAGHNVPFKDVGSTTFSITSGTTTLTASAAVFAAGDVGKKIALFTSSGGAQVFEIDSYTSTTSVEVTVNAESTYTASSGSFGGVRGTTTASSTTLTLEANVLTSDDIGRVVYIIGAGPTVVGATIPLRTTITGVSGTTITLADAATESVINADLIFDPAVDFGSSLNSLSDYTNDFAVEGLMIEQFYGTGIVASGTTFRLDRLKVHGLGPTGVDDKASNIPALFSYFQGYVSGTFEQITSGNLGRIVIAGGNGGWTPDFLNIEVLTQHGQPIFYGSDFGQGTVGIGNVKTIGDAIIDFDTDLSGGDGSVTFVRSGVISQYGSSFKEAPAYNDVLFTDRVNTRVGVNTRFPQADLDVRPSSGAVNALITSESDHANFLIQAADDYVSRLWFGDTTDYDVGSIQYLHFPNAMTFTVNASERLRIDSSGNLLIGTFTTGASRLRIVGLPTSSAGLSSGDVWNDGGTLKIV